MDGTCYSLFQQMTMQIPADDGSPAIDQYGKRYGLYSVIPGDPALPALSVARLHPGHGMIIQRLAPRLGILVE